MKRTILMLTCCAIALKGLSYVLRGWLPLILAWFFFAETSPHILVSDDCYGNRAYLGAHGFQTPQNLSGCPLLILINTKTGETP